MPNDMMYDSMEHRMSDDCLSLLKRKQVYPYDYIISFEKLSDTNLPSKDAFYNKLDEENISDEDYDHALKVWETFKCKDLGEYSDLYLKIDILLLAEVFEKFRTTSYKAFGLDPALYYTLPGYSWDCMLKYTKIKLELITDVDMLMFVERGIRGGLVQCMERYVKANNRYLSDFDSSKPETFLFYGDINNQYGFVMKKYLPWDKFRTLANREIENFNLSNTCDESDTGYILEVDLEYPTSLHELHRDMPFCCEPVKPPGGKKKVNS